MTEDGSFAYTHDAENRLIQIEPAGTPGSGDEKLEFAYDYRNRCVRKLVYVWDPNEGESGDWSSTADVDLRFVYHQGLLLVSFDGLDSNAKVHKFVWGPGANGRLGGMNSLLATRDCDGSTDYVCFNNGKNSVAQLLDRSDGSVDAKYVYDARGDTVRNTGTYAADNPLRYQAMYFHDLDYADTDCDGLYCSPTGNFYSPRLGRRLTGVSSPIAPVATAPPRWDRAADLKEMCTDCRAGGVGSSSCSVTDGYGRSCSTSCDPGYYACCKVYLLYNPSCMCCPDKKKEKGQLQGQSQPVEGVPLPPPPPGGGTDGRDGTAGEADGSGQQTPVTHCKDRNCPTGGPVPRRPIFSSYKQCKAKKNRVTCPEGCEPICIERRDGRAAVACRTKCPANGLCRPLDGNCRRRTYRSQPGRPRYERCYCVDAPV